MLGAPLFERGEVKLRLRYYARALRVGRTTYIPQLWGKPQTNMFGYPAYPERRIQ